MGDRPQCRCSPRRPRRGWHQRAESRYSIGVICVAAYSHVRSVCIGEVHRTQKPSVSLVYGRGSDQQRARSRVMGRFQLRGGSVRSGQHIGPRFETRYSPVLSTLSIASRCVVKMARSVARCFARRMPAASASPSHEIHLATSGLHSLSMTSQTCLP